MRHLRSVSAVALGMLTVMSVGVVAAACTGGSSEPTTSSPSLVAAVTPPGWVPVDFGNAQISVPSDWGIVFDNNCFVPRQPGIIYVGEEGPPSGIGAEACATSAKRVFDTVPMVIFASAAFPMPSPGIGRHPSHATINNLAVSSFATIDGTTYRVP